MNSITENKKNKASFRGIIIFLLLLIWLAISTVNFINNANNYERESIFEALVADTENNARLTETTINTYVQMLQSLAHGLVYVEFGGEYESTLEDMFRSYSLFDNFTNIAIITSQNAYFYDGEQFTVRDYELTQKMQDGEIYITDVYQNNNDETNSISVNVPVYDKNNEMSAYLSGVISTSKMSEIFNSYTSPVNAYYFIIDENGNYVADNIADDVMDSSSSFFTAMDSFEYKSGYSTENFASAIEKREEGFIEYSSNGQPRIAYYEPVNINNWIIITMVPEALVKQNSNQHISNGILFILSTIFAFILLIYRISYAQKKISENALIYEKNISMLSEQINKVIFEWDFENGKLKLMGNYESTFKCKLVTSNWPNGAIEKGMIHKEDKKALIKASQQIENGENVSELVFRIMLDDKNYVWCSMACMPIKDEQTQKIVKAIGLFENIDASMRSSLALREKSEIDALAGIYNKGTTEQKIKEIVENSQRTTKTHTLFIIDIDNFKNINDKLGHQFGDKVITELAKELKNMFRSCDVVGRIGGDEFFAFMKDISDKQDIVKKAEKICKAFTKTYEKDGKKDSISASVGIAIYPKHGKDFDALYKNADVALYETKVNGKNGYTIYSGQKNIDYVSNRTAIESNSDEIL